MAKLTKANEYGQLELNQVAFRRDGRIIAQYQLGDVNCAENGMLLAVDHVNKTINFPTTNDTEGLALNYTTEHMYDPRANALKDFRLEKNSFLPRLGYIGVADKFTTNTVCYDDAAEIGTYKYGKPCSTEGFEGYIELTNTLDGAYVQVLEITDMPDGQKAVKFGGLN